jgi:peptidoglycan/LPS O-acetylase OafA/YrhL
MISKDISESIDIIRGMAALGVIWGHSVYGFNLPLELNGAFWVWIFLPISGYLIGKGYIDRRYELNIKGYKKFVYNRALRIVPLYEIAILLGFVIEKVGSAEKTNVANAIRQATYSTSHVTLAGPLWTVTAEIHFYLISILIIALIIKIQDRPLFLMALLLLSFGLAGFYNGIVYGSFDQPRSLIGNFHFFVFGMILSTDYFQRLFTVSYRCKALIVASLVAIVWYISNWYPQYFWRFGNGANKFIPLGGASLIAMIVAMVVLCVNVQEKKHNKKLLNPFQPLINFFGWCGFYCYGIYVWHSVLAKLDSIFHIARIGLPMLAFLSLAIPFAVISYKIIESPILQFKAASISKINN